MEENRSSSFRVYTPRELSIAPVALRASAPPPSKGLTFSGMLFLVGVALAIGGSSWAAMRYVKSDFVATANAMETKVSDVTPPPAESSLPPVASSDPAPASTTPVTAQTSASAKTTAKPRSKGTRQARPSSSGTKGEKPPPNPYDDLANIDRAPTKPGP